MTEYIFKTGGPDIEIAYSYERWLFQLSEHLKLQSKDGWLTFYAIDKKKEVVDAHLHLHIKGDLAVSPLRATFGSIQCSSRFRLQAFVEFIEYIKHELRNLGVRQVILKNPPDGYYDLSVLHNTALFNLGFCVQSAEIGMLLDLSEEFEGIISSWEKRKLKQAFASGLLFNKVPIQKLADIYSFILACREERKYSLAIEWETLRKTVSTFQDQFKLFEVTHDDKIVAASICIDVGNGILYNFHSAHPKEYDYLSPVVMLIGGICRYGKEKNYSILDLGTSALGNKPNFSLLDFKSRLGGKPSMKLTFCKTL